MSLKWVIWDFIKINNLDGDDRQANLFLSNIITKNEILQRMESVVRSNKKREWKSKVNIELYIYNFVNEQIQYLDFF